MSVGATAWVPLAAFEAAGFKSDGRPYAKVDILQEANARGECEVRPSDCDGMALRGVVKAADLSPTNAGIEADNAVLYSLSEASLLDNLLRRYAEGEPYT